MRVPFLQYCLRWRLISLQRKPSPKGHAARVRRSYGFSTTIMGKSR